MTKLINNPTKITKIKEPLLAIIFIFRVKGSLTINAETPPAVAIIAIVRRRIRSVSNLIPSLIESRCDSSAKFKYNVLFSQ